MNKSIDMIPWKASYYAAFDPEVLARAEMGRASDFERLRGIHERLKLGDFSQTKTLATWLAHPTYEMRRYAAKLFVDVCGHDDVFDLEAIMSPVEDKADACGVALRLGETLSLNAVPMLLIFWEIYHDTENPAGEDRDFDHYVRDGLTDILSEKVVGTRRFSPRTVEDINAHARTLDSRLFYYEGKPAFLGDMTKELIHHAVISYKEKEPFRPGAVRRFLMSSTGIECPGEVGAALTEQDVHRVLEYVERIGDMTPGFRPGAKYFYGNRVP